MKRLAILFLSAGLLASCTGGTHSLVAPLPCGYDLENLADCTVPASFCADDFSWMGGNLRMTVYSEDIYDAVDLLRLQPGDTLLYDGEKIVVETIKDEDGFLTINDGIENGGAWLQAGDGGTYRAVQFDDHSLYTELGAAELPLAENFRIIDCGENPTAPSDTLSTGQKLYLETLDEWRKSFSPLDTRALIEGGIITEITRHWIP